MPTDISNKPTLIEQQPLEYPPFSGFVRELRGAMP